MIIVEPMGGLGNRMRGLDSALALAEKVHRRVRVVWLQNDQLNCRFRELFEPPRGPIEFVELDFFRLTGKLRYGWNCLTGPLRYPSFDDDTVYRLKQERFDFAQDRAPTRRFRTCRSFFPNPSPFSHFVPVAPLREKIDAMRGERQIGVHIRRTDNAEAIKYSPTARFIELMAEEVAADSRVSFFLATDAPDEERLLQAQFPGRVKVHAKSSLDRRTAQAAKDALVDLYALGNCEKIIASYWSSFSDVAAELRGIEKYVVRQD